MKKNKLIHSFLILSIITNFHAHAADENNKGDGNNSNVILPKKLNYDFDAIAIAIREVMDADTLSDPQEIKKIVEFFSKYPSEQAVHAMMIGLQNFAAQRGAETPTRKMNTTEYQSYRMLLTTIQSLIDAPNKKLYDALMGNLSPFMSDHEKQRMGKEMDEVALKISKNKKLRTLNDLRNNPFEIAEEISASDKYLLIGFNDQKDPSKPASEQAQKNLYAQEREQFRKSLQKNIIGQPELVDELVNLYVQGLLMSGVNKGSQTLYMLGAQQSGKLTAVQAYVQAMHPQDPKAIDKHLLVLNEPVNSHDSYWKLIGSSNGYQGAEEMTPFVRFLAEHSGGRYQVVEEQGQGGKKSRIVEDPKWTPENMDPKATRPEGGVIYIKNFQNWSKEHKDRLIKEFLKYGTFELQKNSNGLFKIHVPVTLILSSSEGQVILSTRNLDGRRRGYAFNKEQVQERWQNAYKDEEQLKNALRSSAQRPTSGKESAYGISEDLLSLLTSKIVLLRPLPENELKELAQLKISELNQKLQKAKTRSKLEVKADDQFLTALAQYKLDSEASSAAIATNIEYLVERPLLQFLSTTEELFGAKGNLVTELQLIANPDGTKALGIKITNEDYKGKREFILPIASTQTDKHPTKLTKERIQYWQKVSEKIQQNVFGISKEEADRIASNFMLAEDRGLSDVPDEQKREGALIMAFLGLSSTGKSELTAILSEATLGHRAARFVIDFNQVKTMDDLKAKILGIRDSNGQCKPSDFIEMYTRSNGNLMVVFEEMANAPRELLKAAYDMLREPIVTTFCDGVPRSMKQVKIIITGNAGEEVFQGIPNHMSEELKALMWQQMYEYFIGNPLAQRQILEQYFSKALINRIGDDNMKFMSPLSFKSRWELIQRKIIDNIKALVPDNGRRGWDVKFDTPQDLQSFMEMVDEEGFILPEQGASIDRFVKKILDKDLRVALINSALSKQKMGDGSTILLKFDKKSAQVDSDHEGEQKIYKLQVLSSDKTESIDLDIKGRRKEKIPAYSKTEVLKTAVHEVGHLVSALYIAKDQRPAYLTILPGVANFGHKLGVYLGLAVTEDLTKVSPTREKVVETLARMLGGYVAEMTFYGTHTMGVSSDFERAAHLAQQVILQTGFSKQWGIQAIPDGMSVNDFYASLSDSDKEKIKKEVAVLLEEGRALSQKAVDQAIADGRFEKFTAVLAEKGKLEKKEIDAIAEGFEPVETKKSWLSLPQWMKGNPAKATLEKMQKGNIVTVEELVEKEVRSQREKAQKLEVPMANKTSVDLTAVQKGCEQFLLDKPI